MGKGSGGSGMSITGTAEMAGLNVLTYLTA